MQSEAGRLLIVDDNEMNRDMLARRLAKKGHEVLVAEDGTRALEMIDGEPLDVVLLDIMMPGIDGFEVLEKIRAEHDATELPVIMATAKDDSSDVVAALKLGANDYVTKPFDFPVVLARVTTQLLLKRSRDQLASAHSRMKKDLDAAAKIQQHFLPEERPELKGVEVAWRYLPCDELAGDTLNVFSLDESHVGLMMVDVVGHGVPAALLSVTLSRVMSAEPGLSSALWVADETTSELRIASPTEVAHELVKRFPYDNETGQYFTMVYAVLDLAGMNLTYVAAGHPGPLILRPGHSTQVLETTAPPVGLLPPMIPVKINEGSASLQHGDRVVIVTDGIPEAANDQDEELGTERMTTLFEKFLDHDLNEGLDQMLAEFAEWCGPAGADDDASVLAIEIKS